MSIHNTLTALMEVPVCDSITGAEHTVVISSKEDSEFRNWSPPYKRSMISTCTILLTNPGKTADITGFVTT
jgi:hypothetical protein